MTEFLAMGGYAAYVWGAYGVMALLLATECWHLRHRHRALRARLRRLARLPGLEEGT
ncbi:MAG TPA: heme exporter protein CcmD [Thioalkalivibrio sp.]|nr:heme exporter protein CcmD [Thioalkalivibrio sp.]